MYPTTGYSQEANMPDLDCGSNDVGSISSHDNNAVVIADHKHAPSDRQLCDLPACPTRIRVCRARVLNDELGAHVTPLVKTYDRDISGPSAVRPATSGSTQDLPRAGILCPTTGNGGMAPRTNEPSSLQESQGKGRNLRSRVKPRRCHILDTTLSGPRHRHLRRPSRGSPWEQIVSSNRSSHINCFPEWQSGD